MKDKFTTFILLCLFILVFSSVVGAAVDEEGNLVLKNEYISIFVNQNEYNLGRFAVDVTGGAPMRKGDDGKALIYGRPKPWTSYTTIRIEGKNYVFGGPTKKRAGKGANYGTLVQKPEIEDRRIETKYRYGEVVVTQILSLVKSTTTGLPDTAQIRYQITNQSEEVKKIGTRVMLDTMLGENDGAPFRVQNKAITTDKLYSGEQIPSFWQAFDTLNNPKVTAQGTIKGPGLTKADKVYFTDWGSLADGAWNFDFNPNEEFWRKGEFELDSAMALFWNPTKLKPGETRTYVTNYGLGGITVVPGLLSLGVTSPAEIVMDRPDKKAQIVAYIQNTAEIQAEDVNVELELPQGLELLTQNKVKNLANMEPGSTAQVMWEISPQEIREKELSYKVKVTAENTDNNQVTRSLRIVGPPKLNLNIRAPQKIAEDNNRWIKDEFNIYGEITNVGSSTAYGVNAALALPPGLEIAKGEKIEKFLGKLRAGEEIQVPWSIEPVGIIEGDLTYSIAANSDNTSSSSGRNSIFLAKLMPKLKLEVKKDDLAVGDYVTATIRLENVKDFYGINFNLKYDEYILEPIYVSRGRLFVDNNELLSFKHPKLNKVGLIKGLAASLDKPQEVKNDTIAQIHFKVLAKGEAKLKLQKLNIYNSQQDSIDLKTEIENIKIKEE